MDRRSSHGQRAASEGGVVSAMGTVGEVSSRACKCYRCVQNHHASTCKFKQYECHGCHKKGHLKSMCRSGKVGFLVAQTSGEEEDEEETHRHLSHKYSSEGKQRAMVNNNDDRPSSCKNGN